MAIKVFELSQTLKQQWVTADCDAKRRILEIFWLNCELVDVTLVQVMRKPFDILAEGLFFEISGGGSTPIELFVTAFSGWDANSVRLVGSRGHQANS